MSIELLERGAAALAPFLHEVVFVGGATIVLWITDPAAPAPRPTLDVDVVVEILSRPALHRFEARLRAKGFAEDSSSAVICRWRFHDRIDDDLIVDVMPSEAGLMGFANRWQGAALGHATERSLPSGAVIRAITPPYLVATKLEAFRGRGRGDHLRSQDLEDIVLLADGRAELVDEVLAAPDEACAFVSSELAALLAEARFIDAVHGFVRPDAANQARADAEVLPRLRAIAAASDRHRPK